MNDNLIQMLHFFSCLDSKTLTMKLIDFESSLTKYKMSYLFHYLIIVIRFKSEQSRQSEFDFISYDYNFIVNINRKSYYPRTYTKLHLVK